MKFLFLLLLLLSTIYLLWPPPRFPVPPPTAYISNEPGDTESVYRRAYYTNLSRDEVMDFYFQEFGHWGLVLNYPPEEAQTLIRDQTQSSFLEEIVHPGRESLFINGYVPIKPEEQINREGKHYTNKITVRYIPSSSIPRLTMLAMMVVVIYLLSREYGLVKK